MQHAGTQLKFLQLQHTLNTVVIDLFVVVFCLFFACLFVAFFFVQDRPCTLVLNPLQFWTKHGLLIFLGVFANLKYIYKTLHCFWDFQVYLLLLRMEDTSFLGNLLHAQLLYCKYPGMKLENWDAATCWTLVHIKYRSH